jgi:hypothetical protein
MSLDFEAINRAAWEHIEGLAREIDPSARKEGPEWCINAHWRGEKNRNSLKANVEKCIINDFADRGYDPIKLWATHRGLSNGQAAAELAERFQIAGTENAPWDGPKLGPSWVPMHEALAAGLPLTPPAGHPSKVWTYLDDLGRPLFQRPRYDSPDGSKKVTWWSAFRLPDGSLEWKSQGPPKPRPLYGLERLQDPPRDFVLVVEGEKAADAAQALFPRAEVVTSGASDSAPSTDWTPLKDHQVVLWPDHDEPGLKYAGAVAAALKALGVSLRVVDVPAHFPEKWDLADPVPKGVLPSDLQRMIDEAKPWDGKEEEPPHALDVLKWSDLKDKTVPPVRYVWDPYFPVVPFGILASHPGHGKSLLSLQIAVSVASGMPLFGSQTCGPAGAGVLALEDDQNVIHRRLKAITEAYGPAWTPVQDELLDRNLRVLVRGRTPLEGLGQAGAAFQLAHLAQELGDAMRTTQDPPAILFLDTLNAVHDGDEKDATATRPLIAAIFGLHDALGCSVWALHHLRKSGNTKSAPTLADRLDPELVRGSSALVGGARAVVQFGWILPSEAAKVELETENSARLYAIVSLTKVNDGPLSPWLLLEHSALAGLWVPTQDGDKALASLRGGNAVEKLGKAEAILLDIHAGLDRKALAEKHYPENAKAADHLKSALQDLRRRHGWLQAGKMELTGSGFTKIQELKGRQALEDANPGEEENESWSASA